MDVKVSDKTIHTESNNQDLKKPSREEAMDAVRTLISWAGDDPSREGLVETPKRVVKAYEEFFAGYNQDPVKVLGKTFSDVKGYDDIVFLRDINIETHCEHHMVPILGKAHVAYLPKNKVVGISVVTHGISPLLSNFGDKLFPSSTCSTVNLLWNFSDNTIPLLIA